jgi:chemotaxis protein methyltransferase CheR
MKDHDGVPFLQWALPRLHLRWPGFRKVRRQVYKRIDRRVKELGLDGIGQYRSYLEAHPEEWQSLDAQCWIPISRFYRDQGVFQCLEREVLPQLAQAAAAAGEADLLAWSIGCASGEEPYTLAILWKLALAPQFPSLRLTIVATDVDQRAIERARSGCYPGGSIKDLPADWRAKAFSLTIDGFCVKPEYREPVTFAVQDIREQAPEGPFHLILCRNLVFTYFDEEVQRTTLQKITDRLVPGGALVVGSQESLPEGVAGFDPWPKRLGIYRKNEELDVLPAIRQ